MNTKVEISKRLVLINSASSLLTKAVNLSVLLWLQQYLLRRISPEEYSIYPVLASVIVFAPLFTSILTAGLSRYLVEAYARGDDRGVTQIVSTMFPLLFAAGATLLSGGWVFSWYVDHVLTIVPERLWDARVMMGLLVFSTAVRLPLLPFGAGLYIRQKFVWLNLIGVGTQLLRMSLLFILLFGVSTRVLWVVVATVSAEVSGLVVQQWLSLRLVPALRFHRREIRWSKARQLTSFGAWNFVGQIANLIQRNADIIILNKLATAVDVNSFHLGAMVDQQIRTTTIVAAAPLQPSLTAMHASGDEKRLGNTYLRGGRYALWAAMLVVIPLIIFRREVVDLYVGETYRVAAPVLLLLLAIYPLHYGNVMAAKVAHATAKIRPWVLRVFIIHLLNLFLTLYLVGVRKMGAVGSALSTFVVALVGIPFFLWPLGWRLARVSGWRWLRETLLPGMLPALVGGVVWQGLRLLLCPSSWNMVGLCTACGGVCYIVVLLSFCLQSYEREDLKRVMNRVVAFAPMRRKR